MDDALADAFVKNAPGYFTSLPVPFQTARRMLFIIENNPGYSQFKWIIKNNDVKILTKDVCRALVKSQNDLPEFPETIWDDEFAEYCRKQTGSFYWFRQMPRHFQTQETVNQVLGAWEHYIQYVHPAFITSRLAMKLFRANNNLKQYLPEKYFAEFTQTTGLPDEFFGGETTFRKLKEDKNSYSYCQIGNTFTGFYKDSRYRDAASHVILTRASAGNEQPEIVFRRRVGSFHKSWIEKMIADCDPHFIKPAVSKALKEIQENPYCGVETAGEKDGIELFRSTFMGETVGFTGRKDGKILHGDAKEDVISRFREEIKRQEAA
jgi:hypothetical protein